MIFAKDSNPYNLSYEKWTEKWWRWVFSIPKHLNPLMDNNGEHCTEGQSGPVGFWRGRPVMCIMRNGNVLSLERKLFYFL